MKRKKLFVALAMVLLLFATFCGITFYIFRDSGSWSPSDYTLQLTTWILEAVKTQTSVPQPDDFPANIRFSITQYGLGQCWKVFQEVMERNNNQYRLRVDRIYGDYGTPDGRPIGSTDIVIEAAFPDGKFVEVFFYNETLLDCQFN